jgi:anaerobic dimethyl sulfoxide reductase subunit B (iron-sulfur subunit)
MKSAVSQYAFYFDSKACSGCKACQIACKDKHNLEQSRSWRNVYEIVGGSWEQAGDTWITDVFAYHLSVACNHCENPICAEVCPGQVISKRNDGIVLLDVDNCLGCGYCSWACPYSALDYDDAAGCMTKCTFCVDRIDAGLPPECVAACPMRVLDYGSHLELTARYGSTNGSYPLPEPELTEPQLLVTPHEAAQQTPQETTEVEPNIQQDMKEWPLILFTLLSQLAAGAFLVLVTLDTFFNQPTMLTSNQWLSKQAVFGITIVMITSMLISFLHLGTPQKAYHAISNLKTSWLSREVFFGIVFSGLLVLLSSLLLLGSRPASIFTVIAWTAALAGVLFLYCMSRVYMLRTVSTWNSLKTPLSFFIAALMLGQLVVILYLSNFSDSFANTITLLSPEMWVSASQWLALSLFGLLVIDILITLIWWADFDPQSNPMQQAAFSQDSYRIISGMRLTLTFLGICLIGAFLYQYSFSPNSVSQLNIIAWLSFGLVLIAKLMGRYLFYKSYLRFGL